MNYIFKISITFLKVLWKLFKALAIWYVVIIGVIWELTIDIPIVGPIMNWALVPFFIFGWGYFLIQNGLRWYTKNPTLKLYKLLPNSEKQGFKAKTNEYKATQRSNSSISGFVFGKKGQLVAKTEDKDGHILVIGGAGSGKSSCIAIPSLYSWESSVFAIDIKGELKEKSSNARKRKNCLVFNPLDEDSPHYNPFYMVDQADDQSSEMRLLATSIVQLSPNVRDPFWIKNAQTLLTGLLLYFYCNGFDFAEAVRQIKLKPIDELVAEVMELGNDMAKMEISQYVTMDIKTLGGIFSELNNFISVFATDKSLQRILSASENVITPEALENNTDIFLNIPESKLEIWKPLLSMMVNQFLKAFEQREEKEELAPILFMIDETARLGKIESLVNGLATLRSKKITIALFIQSKSQLNAIYGEENAKIIADNCSYKAILKASEPDTQEWCSKLVGTYEKEKMSRSKSSQNLGLNGSIGTSISSEDKRIIKPEEFAYLDDIVCLFPSGYIRINKLPYYKNMSLLESL